MPLDPPQRAPTGFRVIRFVATILMTAQALLPPGMCPCQFVPARTVPRQATESAEAAPPPSAVHVDDSCCSCPDCRKAVPHRPTPRDADDRPVANDDPAPERQRPNPVSPCSGCPVVSAGPVARAAVLTAPENASLDDVVRPVALTVETTSPRAARTNRSVAPPAPPLFVRHCALLI